MKFAILLILPLLVLVSCDKAKINELNEDIAVLQDQNKQLTEENTDIKMYIEEVASVMESVEEDLDNIVEAEIDIRELSDDVELDKKEKDIKDKLGLIGKYIVDSKNKINDLEKQISASRHDLKGLKILVSNLKTKITTKEGEITTLRQEVGILETDIIRLGDEIKGKDERLADQESIIEEQYMRYYVFDKEKSLKDKDIIIKEGGFLGFGRATKLSPRLNTEYFNVIHAENDLEISIPNQKNKLKIISPHKIDSYILQENENQTTLEILDPKSFWEATKCLVIVSK